MFESKYVKSRFVPTVVYARQSSAFQTRICLYNYFSEIFPSITTGATAFIWVFSSHGELIAQREIHLDYKGQLQYDFGQIGLEFEGTAGVALVPDTLPEFKHRGVGTGYYVYYSDNAGHADFSHEWDAMKFAKSQSVPWCCVIRPLLAPETFLIVMNAYYGTSKEEGTMRWAVRLRNSRGFVLCERKMPDVPPCGSMRLNLQEYFPDLIPLSKTHGTIAVEAEGENMMGPFTEIICPNGDFNIHHFC